MHRRHLVRLLFLPSLTSATTVLVLSAVLLGYNTWAYISEKQVFYEYLFGAYGLKTYFWQQSLGVTSLTRLFWGSTAVYYILVSVVAAIVGLVIYATLQGLSVLFGSGQFLWKELHASGATDKAIVRELARRWSLRTVSLIGWGLYSSFFISTFIPFVIWLNQLGVGAVTASHPRGLLVCLLAFAMLVTGLHLHTVFLRLCCLRVRLFAFAQSV